MSITGTDTTFTVSSTQLRSNNNAIADLRACNEVADTLFAQKKRVESVNRDLKAKSVSDSTQIKALKDQNQSLETLKDSFQKGEKKNRIKGEILKFTATGAIILAAVEGAWIWLTTNTK